MNGQNRVPPCLVISLCTLCLCGELALSNPPTASYIFPAGGQRGTTVPVRVGGLFLHEKCGFSLHGKGLTASSELRRADRVWFEGPVLPLPESQQQEDYPADMLGRVTVAKDAAYGPCRGWLTTSQGVAGGLVFVVGDLPEAVEKERDGDPVPESVTLPVTANGRVFPRDDVDLWAFAAKKGQVVTALAVAPSLGSPLAPHLQILDANGVVLAEPMTYPCVGADASVRFTAPADGEYRVRITDARSSGGPAYVYRLTLTTATVSDFDFPLKAPADGLSDAVKTTGTHTVPVALNGQIEKPSSAETWEVAFKKGGKYSIELQARKAGSPLCGVVAVSDAAGKELARAESADPSADPTLAFTAPADGVYTVRVSERFRGRGGPNFTYRVRITDTAATTAADFRLTLPADSVSVLRGGTGKLKLSVERVGGFKEPIELDVANLTPGVTVSPKQIAANQNAVDLTFKADAGAKLAGAALTITGTAKGETRTAVLPGNRFLPPSGVVHLAVGIPTPFKIVDQYVMTSAPRGEVYRRRYKIERNGFDGPIELRLADKQARHLQGVTGPVVVVPPGQDEVDYPALLAPWMELGRTCRVCVMAVAKVKDADGTEHVVSFSSTEQNQQMIVVVVAGRLEVELERPNVRVPAGGGEVRVPVKATRAKGLTGPVSVEVAIPADWTGVTAAPLTIPADQSAGEVVLKVAADAGPFTMPLTVRATVTEKGGPVVAEAKLEFVR